MNTNFNNAIVELLLVHCLHCCLSVLSLFKLNVCKASRLTVLIKFELGGLDGSVLLEMLVYVILGDFLGQVAHYDVGVRISGLG